MSRPTFAYLPSSHLDLFWLGNYKTCLERGAEIIRQYVERCIAASDETFLVDTVVFAEYFLARYPDLRSAFLQLVAEGRFEIGCAYTDRWETLILGESLIRNVQIGKEWCRRVLGIDNPTITHPDLPSMTPQIAQLYTQAGLRYYVTSRKVFPHGQVWRYQSPDGSRMLVLNYPRHYVFAFMNESDDPDAARRAWVRPLDIEATLQGFPLRTVLVSGSSGDLCDRADFVHRYGRNLEEYVQMYREKYPEYDFTYSTAAQVLSGYEEYGDLPCLSGEIPSVWGVAADEEATFFQRDRQIESQLLTAETLVAVAEHLHLPWRPASADQWQGTFYEAAFFARKDPIQPGKELAELWRMHIFTQDHNGGGQEGALSTFQKRVIQQRCLAYTQEIIDQTLAEIGQRLSPDEECLLVFNPHGQEWAGALSVTLPAERWQAGLCFADDDGAPLLTQAQQQGNDQVLVHVALPAIPSVGYRAFRLCAAQTPAAAPAAAMVQISQDAAALHLTSADWIVSIDRTTGNLTRLYDRRRAQEWGNEQVGRLYAIQEMGNDVTLRIAADATLAEQTLTQVEVVEAGALFTTVRIQKRLLHCQVEQTLTLWNNDARLDLQTRIYWWGAHRQQVRMVLPSTADRADITYGAPFYGVGWTESAEGTSPRNSDEILPADQISYREMQGWLHSRGERGGMTILTTHPAFHHEESKLAAVLLRTSPSCGDNRLFWENAGEQIFTFTLRLNDSDWRAAHVQQQAAQQLRPPVGSMVRAQTGALPATQSFLQVQGSSVALSSLYPSSEPGVTMLRVWETAGVAQQIALTGVLGGQEAVAANLLDEAGEPLAGEPADWQFSLPGWGIRTVRLSG
ncbi:glycoside hydrolase family 38 C-terminal domain-containing protein [Caldilinea sp.]|uniref:glycoside hydrolase family 38 N-terminal domain-containing protein n=1 Tax=Caldilinea sp. TaxID=2293560 RepID=UPI002BE02B80|nr:glycoside hydrolase family 38 C-terminal domain-containing protein [Caldilinea sp.]HRA65297.1 glycoside hydrolase family 38 C-terminal domain-containing protein [Caldilinea sp.]